MSLNDTPSGERTHIGIFGCRNAGKSSIMNAVTGQDLSVVSKTRGTTTDPVKKAMELLPLGPVVFIDTPGLDDEGELGELRVKKAREALRRCDIVLLVVDGTVGLTDFDRTLLEEVKDRGLPWAVAVNKADLGGDAEAILSAVDGCGHVVSVGAAAADRGHVAGVNAAAADRGNVVSVSAVTGQGIQELKELLARINPEGREKRVIADILSPGDLVVMVVPIDSAAPKGRLILPQQQVIRDTLEAAAIPVVCRESELSDTLEKLAQKPRMVVTDSQAFGVVKDIVPDDIYLTSFSILMARYKGDLGWQVEGARKLSQIKDNDIILISEGCTHHRQCDDIGTVKIPRMVKKFTGREVLFEFTSGGEFPRGIKKYSLVIHCGGCTLNEKEMQYRIEKCRREGVPMTNYGVALSMMNGILERALRVFKE